MNARPNQAERRLGAYYRITSDPSLDLYEKIRKLLRFARSSYRMPIAALAQITDQRFEVIQSVPQKGAIPVGTVLELAHTYCAETIVSNHPVGFTQATGTSRAESECFRLCRLEAYLGMRVVVGGRPWGTVVLLSEAPRGTGFNDGDLHFIRLLSEWIGNALTWSAETQTLRTLAEWRDAVFSGISVGIVTCDAQGTLRELNPAAERMFGYDEAEIVGHYTQTLLIEDGPLVDFFRTAPGERKSNAKRLSEQLARDGRPEQVETVCRRRDGTSFPAQVTVSTVFDKSGAIQAHILLIEDITERRAREHAERRMHSTELASTILRGFGDAVIGVDSSPPFRIRLLNTSGERLLGLSEQSAINQPLENCLNIVPDRNFPYAGITEWLSTDTASHCEATAHIGDDGRFPAAIGVTRIEADGNGADVGLTVLTVRNIAHRKQAEERLRLSDKVFDNSAEAILITDADGTILTVNPAFSWITGYSAAEVIGKTPRILKSGRHKPAFYDAMWETLATDGHWEGEIWDRHKAGHLYPKWLTVNAVKEDGHITHYVALFSDISARKEQEERIRFLAEHDQLTGLPNRHYLKQHFGVLKLSERRRDHTIALMMIDLDEFKQINDTLGHAAGDELLVEVGHRLVTSVRDSDIVVRLGGDEFVILLEDVGTKAAMETIAQKVHAAVSQPISIQGKQLSTSPSIGIALGPQDGGDIEALLRKADIAMYRVKVAGRNAWQFFDETT